MINKFRNEYYFLSNYYMAPVTYDTVTYSNNEAAFQAQKVPEDERYLFVNATPNEAKRLGRLCKLREDWEDVKIDIMKEIVTAKFEQNPDLAEKLLNTGDEYLEEGNTWGDKIWGTVNGIGANHLGQILMEVRDKLREKEIER